MCVLCGQDFVARVHWTDRHVEDRARAAVPGFDPVAGMAGAQFVYTVPNFSNPTGRLVGRRCARRRRIRSTGCCPTGCASSMA